MATNQQRFVRYLGAETEALRMLGLFAAGATQVVKRGELIELTANGATEWVPLDSDFVMAADVAIADEEIESGDRLGYYNIIVPRPKDEFRFALAAAGASIVGTALYFSDSETLTITPGTNIVGRISGQDNYPLKQGHLNRDASLDTGVTIRSVTEANLVIREAASYYSAFVTA